MIFTNLLVTYFDYFGITSLHLAVKAKRGRKRNYFLGYYSYPFTSFGKIFSTPFHALSIIVK